MRLSLVMSAQNWPTPRRARYSSSDSRLATGLVVPQDQVGERGR